MSSKTRAYERLFVKEAKKVGYDKDITHHMVNCRYVIEISYNYGSITCIGSTTYNIWDPFYLACEFKIPTGYFMKDANISSAFIELLDKNNKLICKCDIKKYINK